MSALNQPHFQDVEKAREYLESLRWPNGPICPHCGVVSPDHYRLTGASHRPGLLKCKDCRSQFSVTVGTVFERSKIALNVWLQATFLLSSSKKGMSSHQLHRTLGVTYKTAWFMSHRIREAMTDFQTPRKLGFGPEGQGSIVEADETYWGNSYKDGKKILGYREKMKIVSLVERGGPVRSIHVTNVTSKNIKQILKSNVSPLAHLMTDDAPVYIGKKDVAKHSRVNHKRKEYVRGIAHTNTVEGFFSILKRGLIGTYHHVGEQHLQRYCREFDFRYNHRESLGVTDHERTSAALRQIGGKRLTYRRTHAAA